MDEINTTRIKEKFYRKLQQEKARKKIKKPFKVMLVATILIAVATMTVFGQDIIKAVRNYVIGGNINYFVVDKSTYLPVPDDLKGLVFDADGNELRDYIPDETRFYNANGEEVVLNFYNSDNSVTIEGLDEYNSRIANAYKTIFDLDVALQYFIGDVRIPSYMPEDMLFGCVIITDIYDTLYTKGTDNMNISYFSVNGSINLSIKNMGDLGAVGYYTADDGSFDSEPVETTINGHKTTVIGNRLHIEIDNIMYSFSATDTISIDELIKIAESL